MGRFKTREERLRKQTIKQFQTKGVKMSTPRSQKEINDEYSLSCAQLGQLKYKIEVLEAESQTLMEKLKKLNLEGSERQKLDAETTKTETPAEAVNV